MSTSTATATKTTPFNFAAPQGRGLNLRKGDRVLVSETRGPEWHTVESAQGFMVYTEEVPDGFRDVFVMGVERFDECESCGAREGTAHNKNCG